MTRRDTDPDLRSLLAFGREFGLDTTVLLRGNDSRGTSPWRHPAYARPFEFRGHDGVPLAGARAMQDHAAPCLVLTHGLFMNMRFRSIIRLMRRVHEQWGWHVVVWDQRGWGRSAQLSDAVTTGGWAEGRDLVQLARELHEDPRVERVAALGVSLGGASVLHAACHASEIGEPELLDRIVSLSAPVEFAPALRHISTRPPLRDPFFLLWLMFRWAIRRNLRRFGASISELTFEALIDELLAERSGVTPIEYRRRGDLARPLEACRVPVLALHGEDDFCVPVHHARVLERVAARNPSIRVVVRPRGSHAAQPTHDPAWFDSTLRAFLAEAEAHTPRIDVPGRHPA